MKGVNLSKSFSLLWNFLNLHIVVFFKTSALIEVHISHYLHNSANTKVPESSYHILYLYLQTFVANLFYDNFFKNLLFFECSTFFVFFVFFFVEKLKMIANMFSHNRIFINRFHKVSFYKMRGKLRNKIV